MCACMCMCMHVVFTCDFFSNIKALFCPLGANLQNSSGFSYVDKILKGKKKTLPENGLCGELVNVRLFACDYTNKASF